ncbi:MAG: type II toxin-antitoxin system VapC family toxin [Brevundimonas sp.]|uniref:type II toxin-antitoxin system VapC family toxin n=1 Tax=Brevundimonas sp. TaxID=1871086 RepID=UPI002734303B|nr:type II toxin-antitoxin system VapC family toxin [Brevundimonas sp.]MDP3403225.1 type II toxin-antitoxin system VapC family toxin [Brevundimonas sp.]
MTLAVLDASVVVRWYVVDDPFHAEALKVRHLYEAIAPALLQAEVANAMWKYVRIGRMQIEDACEGVAVLSDLLTLTDDRLLIGAAQRLSAELNHPVHDCLYLALARRDAAVLITADRRLADRGHDLGLSVQRIGARP